MSHTEAVKDNTEFYTHNFFQLKVFIMFGVGEIKIKYIAHSLAINLTEPL